MRPQLQQSLHLLHLSNHELSAFISAELERNLLLELQPADHSASAFEAAPGAENIRGEGNVAGTSDSMLTQPAAWPDRQFRARRVGGLASAESHGIDNLSASPSLREHLAEQVAVSIHEPVGRLIAIYLVDLVGETGYLPPSLDDVPRTLGVTAEEVSIILDILQTFEPTGVFARSLQECLALQLAERKRLNPAMRILLHNLNLLAEGNRVRLRRLCKVSEETLSDMIAQLRALDPKPGLKFCTEPVQPLIPDVLVHRTGDGFWQVELNPEAFPNLLVETHYYSQILARPTPSKTREHFIDCLSRANWLVKSLSQRAKTILKVASEIVRQQRSFLDNGIAELRPLALCDVADVVGMHESTISRATCNKYAETPRGIFELKYFFSGAIPGTSRMHSSESVRHTVQKLIEMEDSREVLSDDRIAALLRESGIDIARRTVAKYREAMNIPSSANRRRRKRIHL